MIASTRHHTNVNGVSNEGSMTRSKHVHHDDPRPARDGASEVRKEQGDQRAARNIVSPHQNISIDPQNNKKLSAECRKIVQLINGHVFK